jgi:hypothetical protein
LQQVQVVVDGGRRQRRAAVQQRVGAHAAAVPQLREQAAAGGVHGLHHAVPAGHLRVVVETRRQLERGGVARHIGRFADDQARRRALRIIDGVGSGRDAVGAGTGARDGGHGDAVRQRQVAEAGGCEKVGHVRLR